MWFERSNIRACVFTDFVINRNGVITNGLVLRHFSTMTTFAYLHSLHVLYPQFETFNFVSATRVSIIIKRNHNKIGKCGFFKLMVLTTHIKDPMSYSCSNLPY